MQLSDPPKLAKQYKHTIEVVVDRIVIKDGIHQRLTDSIETAPCGRRRTHRLRGPRAGRPRTPAPSAKTSPAPTTTGHRSTPSSRAPSFNPLFGECSACDGIGSRLEVDTELLVPDPDLTLGEGAIAPWSQGKATTEYWLRLLAGRGGVSGFDLNTPFKDLPSKTRAAIRTQGTTRLRCPTTTDWPRTPLHPPDSEGVKAYIKRKHEETESDFARDRYEQYMRQVACPSCGGARLNPTILGVKVGGQSIADITDLF